MIREFPYEGQETREAKDSSETNKTWPEGIFANRQERVQATNHYPRANGTSPDWSRVQAA